MKEQFDLSHIERLGFGAEPIVPTIVSQLGARLKGLGAEPRISFSYGMTETGLICRKSNITFSQVEERHVGLGNPVSVGGCTFGYHLRIVDDEGEVLAPGAVGSIEVRSAEKLFAGYLDRGEITRRDFTHDGWFKTGDLGRVDDGELTVIGRKKSTIIVNAKKHSLETIEAALRQISSLHFVAAGAVREPTAASDELAVFFVPDPQVTIDAAGLEIRRRVGQHGITVKHLVPLRPDDVPLTATGKVMRDQLLQRYRDGGLQAHNPVGVSVIARSLGVVELRLVDIWQRALKLERWPAPEEDFFELGGDSLTSAEIIAAAEGEFRCELPIERFFERPTLNNMRRLIENCGRPVSHARSVAGDEILHKLQRYSGSWSGERLFDGSFVVGFNRLGSRQPIFWICQEYREALQFSKHLGKDQPLYALRSCVGLVPVKNYDDILNTVCNRYLWEILAVTGRPSVLGGDCQAGIIALELARRLAHIGRPLELLVLQEWTYKRGVYEYPTILIYGENSFTAELYQRQKQTQPEWASIFPNSSTAHVPGKHGDLSWRDDSVAARVKILLREMDARGITAQAVDPETKVEALQTRLAIREAELNRLQANLSAAFKNMSERGADNSDYNLLSGPDGVDRLWYWKTYPDVARAAVDPVAHYLELGWREGRDPRVDFSTKAYLKANKDVRRARRNPLVHYLREGRAAGRKFKF